MHIFAARGPKFSDQLLSIAIQTLLREKPAKSIIEKTVSALSGSKLRAMDDGILNSAAFPWEWRCIRVASSDNGGGAIKLAPSAVLTLAEAAKLLKPLMV